MKETPYLADALELGSRFLLFYGVISLVYDWVPSLNGTFQPHDRLHSLFVAAGTTAFLGFRQWRRPSTGAEGTSPNQRL